MSEALHRLDASETATRIASGTLRVRELAEALLERVARLDGALKAWVYIDHAGVLAEADQLDREVATGHLRGPLHGVPVGLKDIYDVRGIPTRAGSRVRANAPAAEADSAPAAALRRAGALILGKTATTEFATSAPAPTRNPWNLEYEPGGSSSGSAAGVAAGMVPAALGSQTAGSVLRPAAFCGIVGFKPSFGRIAREGILPVAWSLDTMGTLTRSVRDARLLLHALTSPGWIAPESAPAALPPRIGFVPRILADRLDPRMSNVLARTAARLAAAGAAVEEVRLPAGFDVSVDVQHVIMATEAATHHLPTHARSAELYGERLRQLIEAGTLVRGVDYVQAQRVRRDLFERIAPLFERFDALLVPAAAGPAPLKSADFTGDAAFNAPWTLFGLPAIALCSGLDGDGLPLSVQLVGRPRNDAGLLDVAAWCEQTLGPPPSPPEPFA